ISAGEAQSVKRSRAVWLQFFFPSRSRHTRSYGDWSSDVCSSELSAPRSARRAQARERRAERGVEPGRVRDEDGLVQLHPPREEQIGRASCRERVESAVVAL